MPPFTNAATQNQTKAQSTHLQTYLCCHTVMPPTPFSHAQNTCMYTRPKRFTNVFDESIINRIRIFAMFSTEYVDSLSHTKYPSDNRSTHRGNPVIYLTRCHPLVVFVAFAVALTIIMLFIFKFRPSLLTRFSSPLQSHFERFSKHMQRINMCNDSFNRKMSPQTVSTERQWVMLLASGSPVAAMKVKVWTCGYRVELPERNKRKFGNDDRQEWRKESSTQRWKALFRVLLLPRCYDNAGSVVVPSDPTKS